MEPRFDDWQAGYNAGYEAGRKAERESRDEDERGGMTRAERHYQENRMNYEGPYGFGSQER